MTFLNKRIYQTKRLFHIIGITFFIFLITPSSAQITDTSATQSSTNNKQQTSKPHSPRKAALFSTVLPGLGQAYNKKYWKIPVIYGGFAALGYFINSNQTKYIRYRNAYKNRIYNDPPTVHDY